MLTFANFKQVIPSQILTRGRDYFNRGNIVDLSYDEEENVWEAQVEGTELYDVRIEQADSGALDYSCTCPYDMGEHCKHIAAVLYAIEDSFPEQLIVKPRKQSAKRKTRYDKLREQLEKVPHEKLVTGILELAQQNKDFLNKMLIQFSTDSAKPMDYRRVVKDALRTGRGDYGFLDYTGSNRAARKIEELLHQAARWAQTEDVDKAVMAYQAVIDETMPMIEHADDSNGALADCLTGACEELAKCVKQLSKTERQALFDYCLERVVEKAFQGWDWRWSLFDIAVDLVDDLQKRVTLYAMLDNMHEAALANTGQYYYRDFELERIALRRLAIIERFDGKDAARSFLKGNISLDALRMLLIEQYIDEGNMSEALRLIQEGIASSNQRRLPGLTAQYQTLSVKVLKQTGDNAGLIDTARKLWVSGGDMEMYVVMKKSVPPDQWKDFLGSLVIDVHRNPDRLAWLYAQEERWRDLLELIKSSREPAWLIETYRDQLEKHYPDEIASMYERIVEELVTSNKAYTGRKNYQRAAAYLERMKQLGKKERVKTIVTELKARYPQRRALHDELRRL